MTVPATGTAAETNAGDGARVCVVVTCGTGGPVAPTLRALAAQAGPSFDVVLAGAPPPETPLDGGLRVRAATGEVDPLSAAMGAVRERGATVVYWLRAGDEPAPAFLQGTLETLRDDGALGCVSCWVVAMGLEKEGWTPARLDGPTLLGEAVVLPLAVRREALLSLDAGAPLEPGLETWDACLRLLGRGVSAGLVPEPLIVRSAHEPVGSAGEEAARHLAAVRRVLERHGGLCRPHLTDAVVRSEARLLDLVRANFRLESLVASELNPELQRRRRELQRLERRLAAGARGGERT